MSVDKIGGVTIENETSSALLSHSSLCDINALPTADEIL